jgi:hypothetical protein
MSRESTKLFPGVLKALRAHTAKITQDRLKANMENHWSQEIWPPSSPDCNPFFLPHNTLASLRDKILEVMAYMDREVIILFYKKFWSRIKAVVDASGDFFVHVICIYTFSEIFSKMYAP